MNMDSINRIWKIKAPPRVKIFIWIMLRNKILTMDNLIKRGWQTPNRCILCKQAAESVQHLFATCPYVTRVRWHITRNIMERTLLKKDIMGNYRSNITQHGNKSSAKMHIQRRN